MSHNNLVGTKEQPLKNTLPAIGVFIITSGLLIAGCITHGEPESRGWITVLFLVPWLIQLPGLWFLRSSTTRAFWWFNGGATFLCQVSYFLLWIMYSTSWKTSQWGSRYALFLTFLILVCVAIMTFSIMVKPDKEPVEETPEGAQIEEKMLSFRYWKACFRNLRTGVEDYPFWAITYFISLFLGVAYLFGFALAFHDQYTLARSGCEKPALHMVNLNSVDDVAEDQKSCGNNQRKESVKPHTEQAGNASPVSTDADGSSPDWTKEEFCFYFEELKANVGQRIEGCPDGYRNLHRLDPRPNIQVFNSCSLNAIVNTLKKETGEGRRVRVSLLGHTDNEPIKIPNTTTVRYLSNYELSESRAQHVQYEILQQLRANNARNLKNIEWTIFPAGDEALLQINRGAMTIDNLKPEELTALALAPDIDKKELPRRLEGRISIEEIDRRLPPQEKRVVIASIEPIYESPVTLRPDQLRDMTAGDDQALAVLRDLKTAQDNYIAQSNSKRLKLMDYMYFSIYTITTTGYGDIIPTTAYAKFVTSVANIFEVIFLVVFFNVLLSLKESRPPDPNGGLATPKDKPGPITDPNITQSTVENLNERRISTKAG